MMLGRQIWSPLKPAPDLMEAHPVEELVVALIVAVAAVEVVAADHAKASARAYFSIDA
jgi:hypothetical protein